MNKFDSRISNLRINTGNDEYRKIENSKNIQKELTEINTFRLQSPKNIDLNTHKPLKISLGTPTNYSNETNRNKIFFGNINKNDNVNRAIKPSVVSVFNNYQKNLNINPTKLNNLTYHFTQNKGNSFHNKIHPNELLVTNNTKTDYKDSDKNLNKNSKILNINYNRNNNPINSNRDFYYNKNANNNSEKQYKSESPNFRKENLTTRKNFDIDTNYEHKVLHTENLHDQFKKSKYVDIMKLINSNHIPISLNLLNKDFSNFEKSKLSNKSMKYIRGYSANTHQGTSRNYNEDRVSIILNVMQPSTFTGDYWPKCSIFAIFDGHGGAGCADFLRDNLHQFVIRNQNFPKNPKEAILKGFENAEKDYINNHALDKSGEILDRSGSCAIMIFIIANVGDSRGVMSKNNGRNIEVLTKDHKPNHKDEETRITQAGGKIYQTQTPTNNMNLSILQKSFNIDINSLNTNQIILGPCRVFPGRLSVSRSFGDIEAKLIKTGGNPNVVISTPDITSFKLSSDGIFDQLSNKDIIETLWLTTRDDIKANDIHSQCSLANDLIIKTCLNRNCLDNITCVIIAFENFEKIFQSEIIHTYDGNIPYRKNSNTKRKIEEINFDEVEKFKSYSNRINILPISTKNSRPKLPILEENQRDIKGFTPITNKIIKEK